VKVNFIVPEITRTGGMNIIFQYANRLLARGHDVVVYTPVIPFNLYKGGLKIYYLRYQVTTLFKWCTSGKKKLPWNIYPYSFRINFVPVMHNLFVRDADVSVATSWPTAYPVHNFSRSKGRKYYLIQDYEIWNSNVNKVDKSYTLPLNRIVCSRHMQNLLKVKFGSDSELIYIGLDRNRFYNDNKKFNSPARILFADHLLPNKNIEGAIYTCEKLKAEYPELLFRSFGVKKFHKMPDFIEFTENPDDAELTRLYSESDIFLFPSKYEGFGSPPSEAMACKCAIVANAVAAIPEYSTDKVTAVHADPDDKDGLYKGVKYLLDNPRELERISVAGYEHIREFMNWDKSIVKFEEYISGKI
jgi:glycosyltransferase involved in cell wall biosynthesis